MSKNILITLIVLILLAGSIYTKIELDKNTTDVEQPPADTSTSTDSVENSLIGTEWTWQQTTFLNGTKISAPVNKKFVINFRTDKTFTSTTDCNSLQGGFIVDGEILSIDAIFATEMACGGATLEKEYSQQLSRATSYVIVGNDLIINLLKDSGTMIFTKNVKQTTPPPTVRSFEGLNFRLTNYNGIMVEADKNFTLSFKDGSLSAKFCNGMGGTYTLRNNVLTAPNLIGTLMFCEQPAYLMDIESQFGSMLTAGAQVSFQNGILTLTGKAGEQLMYTYSI